jgi:hypothetical protein
MLHEADGVRDRIVETAYSHPAWGFLLILLDGRRLRELGLPPGCIIILLRRGVREEVSTAESRIIAGDQITVLVAPQAAGALRLLHQGTGLGA